MKNESIIDINFFSLCNETFLEHDWMMKLQWVNFTNILQAAFLYESLFEQLFCAYCLVSYFFLAKGNWHKRCL